MEVIGDLRDVPTEEVKAALCRKLLSGGGTTRIWPSDAKVIETAISRNIYENLDKRALRLILERLEIASRGKKSENALIANELQIEHVMPQQWYLNWPLAGKQIPQWYAMYPDPSPNRVM